MEGRIDKKEAMLQIRTKIKSYYKINESGKEKKINISGLERYMGYADNYLSCLYSKRTNAMKMSTFNYIMDSIDNYAKENGFIKRA